MYWMQFNNSKNKQMIINKLLMINEHNLIKFSVICNSF